MPLHVLHHRTCCLNRLLVASLLMWGLCRSAPSVLRVSFASKSNHAVLALRAYNLKGEP